MPSLSMHSQTSRSPRAYRLGFWQGCRQPTCGTVHPCFSSQRRLVTPHVSTSLVCSCLMVFGVLQWIVAYSISLLYVRQFLTSHGPYTTGQSRLPREDSDNSTTVPPSYYSPARVQHLCLSAVLACTYAKPVGSPSLEAAIRMQHIRHLHCSFAGPFSPCMTANHSSEDQ